MSGDSGIKYLISAGSDLEARMIESVLEENGIPCMRKYVDTSLYMQTIFGAGARNVTIDIYVPEPAFEDASKLFEEDNDFEGDTETDPDLADVEFEPEGE